MSPLLRGGLFIGVSLVLHAGLLISPLPSPRRSSPTAAREGRLALHPVPTSRPTTSVSSPLPSPPPRSAPVAVAANQLAPSAVVAPPAPAAAPVAAGATTADESTGAEKGAEAVRAGAEVSAIADEQLCWRSVGQLLQERATTQLPAAVRRRGLTGEVVLRFRLDAQGRATEIRVERRRGAALLEEAAQQLLAEPFALRCAGEGRWPVEFAPPP